MEEQLHVTPFYFAVLGTLRCGEEYGGVESMVYRDKTMVKHRIDQKLTDAGWETDGSFSEHLSIGNWGELCVLVHRSTWETDEPAYELYNVDKHVSYWMHEIPTPERAAALLEEHGEPPEEE